MQRTREGTDRKDCRCRDRRDQQCTCKEDGSGGIRHGIESGVTMVTQGFRDATLYHMSAKDTLHDVGITGITTFSTGIAFDILSRPVQALVRKFRGTVGISGCSEAAEGAGKSAGGTSGGTQNPPANAYQGGSKTISYTDYDNIYKSSIHNAGKDKVMLGKYDGGGTTSYITKAGSEYEYFSLGKDWDVIKAKYGYTDNDMFKLFNEAFLDDGINAGKTFQFSHSPINDTGTLAQEYQYLLNNNYKWDAGTMTMCP